MGLFHKDLDSQINGLVLDLKKSSLKLPENWHWLDYKTKNELIKIEHEDLSIVRKLNQLHEQGKDINSINLRMLQLCTELTQQVENVRKERKINDLSSEGKLIKSIVDEISKIYSREFAIMQRESKKLTYDNHEVQKCKRELITHLGKKDVSWNSVQITIRELLCTRLLWQELTKGESNLLKLIEKGSKYEEHNRLYRKTVSDIEKLITSKTKMTVDDNPAWFQINVLPENSSKKSFFGFSFKVYATIDISSIWDFLKYLIKLSSSLREISLKNQDQISVKIPSSFLAFMKNPDSIVIHYKNHAIKNEIKNVLGLWISDYGIKSSKREYDRTTLARDFIGTSFSDNVSQTSANLMRNNYGKMSNEALAVAGINYAFKLSKDGLSS